MGGVVVIGGGVGGVYTVHNLLMLGFDAGDVTLVADEWPPYTRHRLAEALSLGLPADELTLGVGELVESEGVEVVIGRATGITGRKVAVRTREGGFVLGYDSLVVATGGRPFVPPIEGVDKAGVVGFHGVRDASFLGSLDEGSRVVVVGAGLVGLSVAEALADARNVTLIDVAPSVLSGLLVPELGKFVEDNLKAAGVRVLTGSRVVGVTGDGRADGVLVNGERVEADAVVITAGVRPNSYLLRRDGRPVDVDRVGRTGMPEVYALGDCATSWDFVTGRRTYRPLGFVAGHYARLVAGAIAGEDVEDEGVLPAVYERLGPVEVLSVGLTPAEATNFGLAVEVDVSQGSGWMESSLRDVAGRLVGWQRVQRGHFHSTGSAKAYREIAEGRFQ